MKVIIKECPKCGRILDSPTDKEHRKADKIIHTKRNKACWDCREGVKNRESRL